jgi:outer membrane protein
MPTLKIALLFALVSFSQVYADMIGGEASFGFFNHTPSGSASYKSTASDMEDTLGFSEEQDLFFKAYLEHPFPLLPNVKLSYTTLSHGGSNHVEHFSWGDISDLNGTIHSTLSLDFSDVTLYYEVLDNWAEVDAGITARYITGDIAVNHDTAAFSTWVPMLYGKARFDFPSTDLSFQVEANAISYWDLTAYDYALSARYTMLMGLGLEAGYKAFHLDSDDLLEGFQADVAFSGPYAAVIWDF